MCVVESVVHPKIMLTVHAIPQKWLHHSPKVSQYLPEAGMVLLVGMVAGMIIELVAKYAVGDLAGDVAESVLSFDSSIFFIVFSRYYRH